MLIVLVLIMDRGNRQSVFAVKLIFELFLLHAEFASETSSRTISLSIEVESL